VNTITSTQYEWIGILIARLSVGTLFALSGGGKLFVPSRREEMVRTLPAHRGVSDAAVQPDVERRHGRRAGDDGAATSRGSVAGELAQLGPVSSGDPLLGDPRLVVRLRTRMVQRRLLDLAPASVGATPNPGPVNVPVQCQRTATRSSS